MAYGIVIGGLAAIFAALVIGALAAVSAFAERSRIQRTMSAIDQAYVPVGATRPRDPRRLPVLAVPSWAAPMGRSINTRGAAGWFARWLDYAGNPPFWSVERIMQAQALAIIGLSLVAGILGLLLAGNLVGLVIGLAAGFLVGYFLPYVVLYQAAEKRQERVGKDLPDLLEMVTLSVEAGLGFDQALANLVDATDGPLNREVARVLQEMQMGRGRVEALRSLADRSRVLAVRAFATSVIQATELGVPIAQVLREQAREMRVRRRQQAEEKAHKITVKISMPLVLCLLPALMLVILGPAILKLMQLPMFHK